MSSEPNKAEILERTPGRYTLAELLSPCDADAPLSEEDREWLEAPRAGAELT